jgi:monothiol glutaredoxin
MTDNPAHERIASNVAENDVLLFMKGTPVFPQCGFSALVVQVLSNVGVKFKAVDVLKDADIRQGVKEYSDWPTIPQLYVKGEFIGGCDIIRDMTLNGEFDGMLSENGVHYNKDAAEEIRKANSAE